MIKPSRDMRVYTTHLHLIINLSMMMMLYSSLTVFRTHIASWWNIYFYDRQGWTQLKAELNEGGKIIIYKSTNNWNNNCMKNNQPSKWDVSYRKKSKELTP